MTALLLVLPLALLSFKNDFNFDFDIPKYDIVQTSSKMEIASDSGFSNQTTNFNPGQTVYVKITSDVSGSSKKALNLRDNQYNLITSFGLSQISSSPYQFTASLTAPSAGNYSLEANLETDGSVVNLVRTIQVGNGSTSSSNSVKIKNEVNTSNSNQVLSESSQNSPSPESSPAESTESPGQEGVSAKGIIQAVWTIISAVLKFVF